MQTRDVAVPAACVLTVVLVAAGSYQLGRHHTATVAWHTGLASIGDSEASITTPGWTYGFGNSVPQWIDADGAGHGDSWPDCVNPPGTNKLVTFATVTVSAYGGTTRPVVLVDCRQH
jgi:hypothetical protein